MTTFFVFSGSYVTKCSCVFLACDLIYFLCVKGPVQLISHVAQNFAQKFLRPSNSEGNA